MRFKLTVNTLKLYNLYSDLHMGIRKYDVNWGKQKTREKGLLMKLKKKEITAEQYRRTNKTLMVILTFSYLIYVGIDISNVMKGALAVNAYIRCAVYVGVIIVNGIILKLFSERKMAAIGMALTFLVAYTTLVFGNGAGTLVMAFPAVVGFMIYLNAPLVVVGCVASFIICVIKCLMIRSDVEAVGFASVATLGMFVAIFASWRAINLLIDFSQEDQEVIIKEAERRNEVAKMVAQIVEKLNTDFRDVVAELSEINISMDSAHSSMETIAASSEETAKAVSQQADMTEQIQERLEKANGSAMEAKDITANLKDVIISGKQNADELQERSQQVDRNTEIISDTVSQLVENVQKVSNIIETIMHISSQTNMLALNASIEAARAGELGKGFAVVADQIRDLAEQTKVSTGQITDIIEELNAVTNETRKGLQESVDSIVAQRQKVEEVTTNFTAVESGMLELETGMNNMGHQVRRVLVANKQIVDSISTLSAASEEVSAGSQAGKENMDNIYDSLNGFSQVIEGTFKQLQLLKETTEQN